MKGIVSHKIAGVPSVAWFDAHISRWCIRGLPRKTSYTQRCARVVGECHGIENSGTKGILTPHWRCMTLLFTLEPEEILHFQTTLFHFPTFLSFLPYPPFTPVSLNNSPITCSPLYHPRLLPIFPVPRRKAELRCARRSSLPFIVIPEPLSERSRTRKNACTRIDIR